MIRCIDIPTIIQLIHTVLILSVIIEVIITLYNYFEKYDKILLFVKI